MLSVRLHICSCVNVFFFIFLYIWISIHKKGKGVSCEFVSCHVSHQSANPLLISCRYRCE
ncbi:unnamed protein product [Brassica rapa]|uniref:Uncharacterized protein n=2 Tax=Brassica TaxID=3705 RepID=A0A8D9FZJ1_BRACM|nr:unnamed protein product [Brassica napus]CAG7862814.1 unnamed protein product [Brassica rapa]